MERVRMSPETAARRSAETHRVMLRIAELQIAAHKLAVTPEEYVRECQRRRAAAERGPREVVR